MISNKLKMKKEMIHLMVGNNWDTKLLAGFYILNEKYKKNNIKVSEIYGSLLDNPIGTARPNYRVQDKSLSYFEMFIKSAKRMGIDINYTINTPCFGSLQNLKEKETEIIDFLQYLENVGIRRVTLSHPLLIDFVNKYTKLQIELSTIYEIDNIQALNYFEEKIDKVCMKIAKNRDFKFLKTFQEEAVSKGITVELLANEFCYIYCVDRTQCYLLHGHTKEKNKLYGFYPMGKCISKRYQEPVEWIKAPFILPQWMSFYQENVNINHFKITGRTHPTKYILWVTEQYMKKVFCGNLLELWAHLENIGKEEGDYSAPQYTIDINKSKLLHNKNNFLDMLSSNSIDCAIDCGYKCILCNTVISEKDVLQKLK